MKEAQQTFVASAAISEIQSSDIYLTVKARLFDLKPNKNHMRVTEAFIDEIVGNEDKYIGIPLCADVRGLIDHRKIGHMYDAATGKYYSSFIGSFYHFEKEASEDDTYLVGYARIMKRHEDICAAVNELYNQGKLLFSFEISCRNYRREDGIIVIDADERNFLEGAAIVSDPACPEAAALQLVAECLKGDEPMDEKEKVTAEQPEEIQAEAEKEQEEVVAETKPETEAEATAETAPALKDPSDKEQKPEDPEAKEEPKEEANAACKEELAEDKKEDVPEEKPEEEEKPWEKTAEVVAKLEAAVEALQAEVTKLRAEAAETAKLTAEAHTDNGEVNPFTAEINANSGYTLLESVRRDFGSYSLLDEI